MIFFTLEFACFFLVFLLVYWLALRFFGRAAQNLVLLGFNYALILWVNPYFAVVVFIYSVFIYFSSILIVSFDSRICLAFCLSGALLNLCFFKYFPAIKDSFDFFFGLLGLDTAQLDFVFPLGLSFYTFASITYLHSVHKGAKCQDLASLLCYLSFFPTFISGPIFSGRFFFLQLHSPRTIGHVGLIVALIIFGITKKVLIANYLHIYSDPILHNPSIYSPLSLLLGIYAYSIQLYCDFSGYVNLVAAFGLMLGFNLPKNFNMPYSAHNIKEFWARWHITLSHFIRDYIYIPLGGNRRGFFLAQVFVLIAFGLSGIWHGDTWNFLIWGLLHGLATIVLNICRFLDLSLPRILGALITFHFVTFAWLFFGIKELQDSIFYIQCFFTSDKSSAPSEWLALLLCGLAFFVYPYTRYSLRGLARLIESTPLLLQPVLVAAIIILVIGLSANGIPNFIYERF